METYTETELKYKDALIAHTNIQFDIWDRFLILLFGKCRLTTETATEHIIGHTKNLPDTLIVINPVRTYLNRRKEKGGLVVLGTNPPSFTEKVTEGWDPKAVNS